MENSSLSWIARNGSKPQRSGHECWAIHASREWSQVYLEHEPKDVAEQLMHTFFEEVGVSQYGTSICPGASLALCTGR